MQKKYIMTRSEISTKIVKNEMIILFGEHDVSEGEDWLIVLFYTFVLWILSDFSRFILHYLF